VVADRLGVAGRVPGVVVVDALLLHGDGGDVRRPPARGRRPPGGSTGTSAWCPRSGRPPAPAPPAGPGRPDPPRRPT
jgi:hypothetical protein